MEHGNDTPSYGHPIRNWRAYAAALVNRNREDSLVQRRCHQPVVRARKNRQTQELPGRNGGGSPVHPRPQKAVSLVLEVH